MKKEHGRDLATGDGSGGLSAPATSTRKILL